MTRGDEGRDEDTTRFRGRSVETEAAFFLPLLRPGMTLLDVGCGPGSITLGLAAAVTPGRVVGIDMDPERVAAATLAAAEAGVNNVEFLAGDATRLDFSDGEFDAVFANGLVEHLSDPDAGLREMRRVITPGGVIGVRSPDWGAALLEPDSKGVRGSIALRNRWQRHNGGDPHAGRRLRGLLTRAGFADVEAGATADSHGSDAGTREGLRYMRSILDDPELAKLSAAEGWASGAEIEEMRDAWRRWARTEGAFAAFFWCHATGRAG